MIGSRSKNFFSIPSKKKKKEKKEDPKSWFEIGSETNSNPVKLGYNEFGC
jgi:hypothetical protein